MRILALAVVLAARTAAGQHPDFSGIWVRQDSAAGRTVAATGDAGFRRGDMGSGWGTPLTLTLTSDQLKVVYDFYIPYDLQPKVRYTFAVGGAESKNVVNVGNVPVEMRNRTVWRGDTLEITSRFAVPPEVSPQPDTPDLIQRLWIDPQGRLTIDARRRGAEARVNSVVTVWTKR